MKSTIPLLGVFCALCLAATAHAAESNVTLTNFKLTGDLSGDGAADPGLELRGRFGPCERGQPGV